MKQPKDSQGRFTTYSIVDKFLAKVEVSGDCWLWKGAKTNLRHGHAYGVISDKNKKRTMAHRVSWEIYVGPIPEGLCICHHCDNGLCVKPAHLFIGTIADNNRDAREKGRIPFPKGEFHGMAKLESTQVLHMRMLYQDGLSTRKIASKFGISKAHAFQIVAYKRWKHI